jgi:ABC-type sugar transport system ATPase subunit
VQRNLAVTTIYVTHDRAEAKALAHRAVLMDNGCIEVETDVDEKTREPIVESYSS